MDETVPSLATIVENLARAQCELLRAAEAVPEDQWKTRPAEGRWSAGELIGHLSAVERAILSRADKLLQKPPKSLPLFQAVSCSDDGGRSTRDPAQDAEVARRPNDPRKRRDAGGIAWNAGANAGVHRRDEEPRPQ